jgi:hypothetical protein
VALRSRSSGHPLSVSMARAVFNIFTALFLGLAALSASVVAHRNYSGHWPGRDPDLGLQHQTLPPPHETGGSGAGLHVEAWHSSSERVSTTT